jgi:hypothetical protein
VDTRNEIREFLTSRRAKITAEPGSKSEEALNLLASWTAIPDREETHADH